MKNPENANQSLLRPPFPHPGRAVRILLALLERAETDPRAPISIALYNTIMDDVIMYGIEPFGDTTTTKQKE